LAVAHLADLLHAHLRETVAVDFFLVSTLTCLFFVFLVLRHDRRELLQVERTGFQLTHPDP
jgi:hypothetical protein